MKNRLLTILFSSIAIVATSQQCPPEWMYICSDGYLYDVQSDHNTYNLSETDFKKRLLENAFAGLARRVEVRIKDEAAMSKYAENGNVSKRYASTTTFSTDVELELVENKTIYNAKTREGYAIAYIDKSGARQFYRNKLQMTINNIENVIKTANIYIEMGFKAKAGEELQKNALPLIEQCDEPLFWLNFYELPTQQLQEDNSRVNALNKQLKQMVAELIHGTTIFIECKSDLFGSTYPKLEKELKGILSKQGCNFVNSPETADWVIRIESFAREYNQVSAGQFSTYFAYVESRITIYKTATNQRVCEDQISVKDGHTFNYTEAAKAAYKQLSSRLSDLLKEYINE